jgi:NitT/TauT family transport system substrate-binding protein
MIQLTGRFLMMSFLILGSVIFCDHALAAKPVDLALNWKPEPEFGGFYQASNQGLYEKAGLQLKVIPGGAGQPIAQMLAAKKATFGIVAADELILARAQGAKIKAIFAVYQKDPQGFMVRADRPIQSLKELFQSPGTIALQKGLPYTLWLQKQYAPIRAKVVPYTGGITTFMRDPMFAQQCFIFSEPIAARREKLNPKVFLISESGFDRYLAVVAVHEDTLAQSPGDVDAFVKASREGWQQYLKDPSSTNVLMQKLNPSMDLATFNEAAREQMPFVETEETKKLGLGIMSAKRWAHLYEQLQEIKLAKPGLDPSTFLHQK